MRSSTFQFDVSSRRIAARPDEAVAVVVSASALKGIWYSQTLTDWNIYSSTHPIITVTSTNTELLFDRCHRSVNSRCTGYSSRSIAVMVSKGEKWVWKHREKRAINGERMMAGQRLHSIKYINVTEIYREVWTRTRTQARTRLWMRIQVRWFSILFAVPPMWLSATYDTSIQAHALQSNKVAETRVMRLTRLESKYRRNVIIFLRSILSISLGLLASHVRLLGGREPFPATVHDDLGTSASLWFGPCGTVIQGSMQEQRVRLREREMIHFVSPVLHLQCATVEWWWTGGPRCGRICPINCLPNTSGCSHGVTCVVMLMSVTRSLRYPQQKKPNVEISIWGGTWVMPKLGRH
jgi:hypothetical protein